jgi:hypothetical protein
MNIPARIYNKSGKLIVELPLSNPTGKIRLKRRNETTNYGLPIAARKEKLTSNDYIEWQISYASSPPPRESEVKEVILSDGRVGCELTKLLWEGLRLDILSAEDITEMMNFVSGVRKDETLEENERIIREETPIEIKGGFRKFIEKSPLFLKRNEAARYFVEIALKHKQRAVGLQAMVYLCIYIENLKDYKGDILTGKMAGPKGFGILEVTSKNKEIISDTVKAFALASRTHNNDIRSILKQIEEKWRQ